MVERLILIRHGKPAMRVAPYPWKITSSHEINFRMDEYDRASLDSSFANDLKTRVAAFEALSSDLIRASETASIMSEVSFEMSELLREVPLPRFESNFKLPAIFLVLISRLRWYGGAKCIETRSQTKERVKTVADLIEQKSSESLALYSHGFFLWLLGRELRARGWRSEKRGPYTYAEVAEFWSPVDQ